jgi:ribosomal-protein-alanine N-acetyltransferase
MKFRQPCTVVPYAAEHLEDVSLIDRLCFIDPWFKRSFMDELNADCALNLVAIDTDESMHTLGYCLTRVVIDECTINRLAVHPDYQRNGIATRLLKACLYRAGLQGATSCFIDVRAGNTAARGLYEGHGFKHIGTRSGYYQIGAEDAILMRCAIDTSKFSETVHHE